MYSLKEQFCYLAEQALFFAFFRHARSGRGARHSAAGEGADIVCIFVFRAFPCRACFALHAISVVLTEETKRKLL